MIEGMTVLGRLPFLPSLSSFILPFVNPDPTWYQPYIFILLLILPSIASHELLLSSDLLLGISSLFRILSLSLFSPIMTDSLTK